MKCPFSYLEHQQLQRQNDRKSKMHALLFKTCRNAKRDNNKSILVRIDPCRGTNYETCWQLINHVIYVCEELWQSLLTATSSSHQSMRQYPKHGMPTNSVHSPGPQHTLWIMNAQNGGLVLAIYSSYLLYCSLCLKCQIDTWCLVPAIHLDWSECMCVYTAAETTINTWYKLYTIHRYYFNIISGTALLYLLHY